MADQAVRLGNLAPSESVRREVSALEAREAGARGRKELSEEGIERYFALEQRPIGHLRQSITTFVVPAAMSQEHALGNLELAFSEQHSRRAPEWIHTADDELAGLLSDRLRARYRVDVPRLRDEDLNSLLTTDLPGGIRPIKGGAIQTLGRDLWAQALGDPSGAVGTATTVSTTALADTSRSWSANEWVGKDVICGGAIGTVLSNTATSLTVARWETPGARSGAAASTPGAGSYVICSGGCPAYWMGCSADAATPVAGGPDTVLPGEITTAGSGFVRAVPLWGHTAGTNFYTLTITFAATGSDTFPQDINKVGVFNAHSGGRLAFETLLPATFQANLVGDAFQATESVTGS